MKPILFNTEMVRAILEARKTVTRRVIKPQPCEGRGLVRFMRWFHQDWYTTLARFGDDVGAALCDRKPPYNPGDILWVRETFFKEECTPDCAGQSDPNECPFNRVGDSCYGYKTQYIDSTGEIKWRPSIHMPKEAARLFLRVTGVRVEQLRDIDLAGCRAEGIWDDYKTSSEKYHETLATRAYPKVFGELWNSTIKLADLPRYGWEANPWVWVIEFERISREAAIGGGGDG